MAIVITDELMELKAQAEGARPFRRSRLFDKLAECVGSKEYWSWTPQQRLSLGYYLAAERRFESLRKDGPA